MNQLAFPSVAGSVLRQGTSGAPYWTSLADLKNALGVGDGAKIEIKSYAGTDTYGDSNPCSLTFSFAPTVIRQIGYGTDTGDVDTYNGRSMIMANVPTAYDWCGFGKNAKGCKSSDGKTFSWYYGSPTGGSASAQLNQGGLTYYFMGIA